MTQEKVKELFEYNDGKLYWKLPRSNRLKIGDEAGYINGSGYTVIMVVDKNWRAHRLIFLLHHGYLPEFIDHVDTNKSNNRIENLRAATKSQNMAHRGKQKNNTTGYKGVHFNKADKIYTAHIQVNGTTKHLGRFKNPELAHRAYVKAATIHNKEFAHA